jgi:small-conductance mechanosensitive channel
MPSDKENDMHPRIQERNEGLQALRARLNTATHQMYALIRQEAPVQKIRYQVVTKGEKAYHIVELATRRVWGFRFTYKAAVNFAQELEARADAKAAMAGVQ